MYPINLTPHAISLHLPNGEVFTIRPAEKAARVVPTGTPTVEMVPVARHDNYEEDFPFDFPVASRDEEGQVVDLPEENTFFGYIVSAQVGAHPSVKGRKDVFTLGTGPNDGAVRNEKGQIVGVTRLKRV